MFDERAIEQFRTELPGCRISANTDQRFYLSWDDFLCGARTFGETIRVVIADTTRADWEFENRELEFASDTQDLAASMIKACKDAKHDKLL